MKPAKPAPAQHGAQTGGKGTATHKHHSAPAKHQPKKARKWTPDSDVALCSARAVAESLRLAGGSVSDADVLALYWHTAADADAGASILETLEAARWFGLAGARPVYGTCQAPFTYGQIIGVDIPQPHAVAVAADGTWWSWGEPHEPWTAEIDEAWEVSWR
jgi:hypothetical protein